MTPKNIYTDGTYLRNNPSWNIEDSGWKANEIYLLIKKNEIIVNNLIEIGCGAGGILDELSRKMPSISQLQGYDISEDAINLAKKKSNDRLEFINSDLLSLPSEKADLILAIDVLEHVEDYYRFLNQLLSRANFFIFHIPLDISFRTLLKPHTLLYQRKSVGHIHYFSKEMVFWMLEETGYSVIDWHYTKPVGDIKRSKNLKQWIKKILRNISFYLSKHLSDKLWGNYSLLILAKKKK
jgi:cyclopropane fatty-acyl-phospholipid synthase-like methyltransferase